MTATAFVLTVALGASRVSQLESIKVEVTLTNQGPAAEVPSAYDISGALEISIRGTHGVVRKASGITMQEMMVRSRVNAQPSLERLESGGHWSVVLDLGQSMYSPPPGAYRLSAELWLPDGSRVTSNEAELEVVTDAVRTAQALRDNPVLDGLLLLIERENAASPFVLRQYNHSNPLGAWYGEVMPLAARPAIARPTYFATDSFEHFFTRWLVVREGELVMAEAYTNGRPSGARLEARLDADQRLLPSVCDHGASRLELFAIERGLELVALKWQPASLIEHFRLALPAGAEFDPEIVGIRGGYWMATARAGLAVASVDEQGKMESWRQRFNTDLVCHSLRIDPVDGRILAAYWDGPLGRHLQLLEADLVTDRFTLLYQEREGPLSSLVELAYDCDARGTFHLLANCADGLFYQRHDGSPFWLAPTHPRRAPIVSARSLVHLAFYDADRGYQVYRFKHGLIYRDLPPESGEAA